MSRHFILEIDDEHDDHPLDAGDLENLIHSDFGLMSTGGIRARLIEAHPGQLQLIEPPPIKTQVTINIAGTLSPYALRGLLREIRDHDQGQHG